MYTKDKSPNQYFAFLAFIAPLNLFKIGFSRVGWLLVHSLL